MITSGRWPVTPSLAIATRIGENVLRSSTEQRQSPMVVESDRWQSSLSGRFSVLASPGPPRYHDHQKVEGVSLMMRGGWDLCNVGE